MNTYCSPQKLILTILTFFITLCQYISPQDLKEAIPQYQVRFIRTYGGNDEKLPPIIYLDPTGATYSTPFGERYATLEMDIQASVPPTLYARFVHCTADWKETENVFINDIAFSRTSNFTWESSPAFAKYYDYRAKLSFPNEQIKFKFSGNWKIKIYEFGKENTPVAEARFFVVQPKAECILNVTTDFYEPKFNVSPTSWTIEAIIRSNEQLIDSRLSTVVIYRNHRWYEPYYISNESNLNFNPDTYKYKFPTMIGGFLRAGKVFRIEKIPAENAYRILNLTDLAQFPRITGPVRLPFSDIRRNGTFWDYDDDGAMITKYVSSSNDDYVYLEFVLNPDGRISNEDVFIIGSFNNWKPDPTWIMYYDEEYKVYKSRQWVRRARHNYLYGSGIINLETQQIEQFSTDQYEGNTSYGAHTIIAFAYYKEFEFGGYDALIAIGAGNVFGNVQR